MLTLSSSLILIWIKAVSKSSNYVFRLLIICAFFLSFFSTLGALGGKEHLISSVAGGRYFFASNVLVYLCVMAMANGSKKRINKFALAVLMISCISLVGRYMPGPDWNIEYERAIRENSPWLNIWPDGWVMKNPLIEAK